MVSFTKKIVEAPLALNFDDLILLPGFSETRTKNINIETRFSTNIKIKTPLSSAPMDTVTEAQMAVAMAQCGGIGVLHRNCSIEEELQMVKQVKVVEASGPDATLGRDKRLAVAAAISPFDLERARVLGEHADALVIDVAHFHTNAILEATREIIKATDADIVIGSLGTKAGVKHSVENLDRVDGLRCGIGGGSICITTDVTKAGSPVPFAVSQAADALEEIGRRDIPIIGDGGIRTAGDIAIAFALGATSAMLGYGFAGTDECPGDVVTVEGKKYKSYRGMGSQGARERRAIADRYADTGGRKLIEGIEGLTPYKGRVSDVIELLNSGIRASIGYGGAGSIEEMHRKAVLGRIGLRTQKAEIRSK